MLVTAVLLLCAHGSLISTCLNLTTQPHFTTRWNYRERQMLNSIHTLVPWALSIWVWLSSGSYLPTWIESRPYSVKDVGKDRKARSSNTLRRNITPSFLTRTITKRLLGEFPNSRNRSSLRVTGVLGLDLYWQCLQTHDWEAVFHGK